MSDPSKGQDLVELKCPRCGYKWRTRSKLMFVTCPSCQVKVPNRRERK